MPRRQDRSSSGKGKGKEIINSSRRHAAGDEQPAEVIRSPYPPPPGSRPGAAAGRVAYGFTHTGYFWSPSVQVGSPVWRRRVLILGWRRPGSQDQCRTTPSRLPSRPQLLVLLLLLLVALPLVGQQYHAHTCVQQRLTPPTRPVPARHGAWADATYVSHGCWSSGGRRAALFSRRTAAEDTRYPRTTARRWLPPAPPITLMYTLMYTPLGYVHSVHSFTRSGCPLGLRVECLVVDTAGQGARPLSSRRASRQPLRPGFDASPASRVPAHVIDTSLSKMPTLAALRLPSAAIPRPSLLREHRLLNTLMPHVTAVPKPARSCPGWGIKAPRATSGNSSGLPTLPSLPQPHIDFEV
ncbi:hypothetical protein O3P69_015753 [Scylla paramamosain]|uniref:Uncharacterized protein n=1 Tax=Scylla paramamosain TaxID=85552 RepID=A0AAW0T9W0_SCYPA